MGLWQTDSPASAEREIGLFFPDLARATGLGPPP
jgi:hypothetical protein